jgi:hypothetical protein
MMGLRGVFGSATIAGVSLKPMVGRLSNGDML